MTNSIPINAWIDAVDREYLSTFISDGGSTVKFVVTSEDRRTDLRTMLRTRSDQYNFRFVEVEAAACRAYMPQDIFFALAKQIDWRLTARRTILRLLDDAQYRIDNVNADHTTNIINELAEANGLEPGSVMRELRPILQEKVFKNPYIVRAFRIAMSHICIMEREVDSQQDYRGQPLLDWLTGENLRIGNVRGFDINTVINRATARYMIESALYWIRFAGYSGTVLFLDNSRVTLPHNPRDGKRYYTKAMAMDHYELLREFIDDIGRLSGLFLVVATDYEFINDDSLRGWSIYSALRTRVMDDVRDKNAVNPVSALVRLS